MVQQSAAQSRRCSQRTINHLEAAADGIRDWSALQAFYHRYHFCQVDDAEVSTGVSESVARMLADSWETLSTASILFRQDPAFEAFALAGLNITDSNADLKEIDKLAEEHCPKNLHALCRRIRYSILHND